MSEAAQTTTDHAMTPQEARDLAMLAGLKAKWEEGMQAVAKAAIARLDMDQPGRHIGVDYDMDKCVWKLTEAAEAP